MRLRKRCRYRASARRPGVSENSIGYLIVTQYRCFGGPIILDIALVSFFAACIGSAGTCSHLGT